MKKIWIIVMFISMLFLVSCGQDKISNKTIDNNKKIDIIKEEKIEKESFVKDIDDKDKKQNISIQTIKNKLDKLEKLWVWKENLRTLDEEIWDMIEEKIQELAFKNIKFCSKSISSWDCIKTVALWKKDLWLCKKIENDNEKKSCINLVLVEKAIETKDSKICEKILDNSIKKRCFDKILLEKAKKTLDMKFCNKLSNEEDREICIDQIEENR